MGLFGGDSTTNQTTNNVSPSAASQTSNAPSSSVVSEGNVTINQTITDLDAIAAAENIALEALYAAADSAGGASEVASDAVFTSEQISQGALDLGSQVIDSNEFTTQLVVDGAGNVIRDLAGAAGNIISDAFFEVGDSRKDAFNFAGDVTLEAFETIEEQGVGVLSLATDALFENNKLVDKVTETVTRLGLDSIFAVQQSAADALASADAARGQALEFGNDALDVVSDAFQDQTTLSLSVLDLADEVTGRTSSYFLEGLNTVATTVEDLNDSRADESESVLAAVTKLGETVSTSGENLRTDANKLFNLAMIAVLGFVAWQAVRAN